jgi:hypothetical protein
MNTARWKAIIAAALIFVFGAAVGAVATAWYFTRQIPRVVQAAAGERAPVDDAVAIIERDLVKKLELDENVRATLHAELAQAADEVKSFRLEGMAKFAAIVRLRIARIEAALPPAKRAHFRELADRRLRQLGFHTIAEPETRRP